MINNPHTPGTVEHLLWTPTEGHAFTSGIPNFEVGLLPIFAVVGLLVALLCL